jgi:hypothetical protein
MGKKRAAMRVEVFLFLALLPVVCGFAQSRSASCRETVTLLIPQLVFKSPVEALSRVEVKRCSSNEVLRIIASGRTDTETPLEIDTTDFTIIQAYVNGSIVLIETTGGPRSRVYIIQFHDGKPRLAAQRVTRGRVSIRTEDDQVSITIPNTATGRSEELRFSAR